MTKKRLGTTAVWDHFPIALLNLMDIAIPFKSRKNNSSPLWATAAVRQARAKRNQTERNYMGKRTKQNRSACRTATRVLRKTIKSAIKKFEQQLVSNANTKPFWHYVQSTRKIKASIGPLVNNDDGNLTTNDQVCADILSQFYCSVLSVYQ